MAGAQDDRSTGLAWALSMLAGYVDAVGVIELGGYFASFMSGNSTLTAVNLGQRHFLKALQGLAVIALFVAGLATGSLIALRSGPCRRQQVLALEAVLLLLAALLASAGWGVPAMALVIFAMGLENEVIQREGALGEPLTYMTGTLVKMAQHIALALAGKGRPGAWLAPFYLWLSFVAGAAIGTLVHARLGLAGLWPAALYAIALCLLGWRHGRALP